MRHARYVKSNPSEIENPSLNTNAGNTKIKKEKYKYFFSHCSLNKNIENTKIRKLIFVFPIFVFKEQGEKEYLHFSIQYRITRLRRHVRYVKSNASEINIFKAPYTKIKVTSLLY